MLLVLLLLPIGCAYVLWQRQPPALPVSPDAVSPEAPQPTYTIPGTRSGPWGQLTVTPVTIRAPIRLIPPVLYTPRPVQWEIAGADEAQFRVLLTEAGVEPSLQKEVVQNVVKLPTGRVVLEVKPDLIRQFSPEVRGRLYRALLKLDRRNREIFGLKRWSQEQWQELATSLPPAVATLVPEFFFPATSGSDVHFWDLSAALHFIPDERDRIALVRALNRQRTFLLSLTLTPASNVPEIAEYWGLATNRRQFIPMLESLTELDRPAAIDALHLLPEFVRKHAYTYPGSTVLNPAGDSLDCFWTCANFERPEGLPPIPPAEAAKYLTSHYVTYVGRPEFGDIIVLQDEEGTAIHVAVHIADNIVFTKNGKHPLMPWVFMEREEMLRIYELAIPEKTLWVRRATDES